MTLAVRNMTRDMVPPILPSDAPLALLPVVRPRGTALADLGRRVRAFFAWAVEAAGIKPFVRLAQRHPTLFQGVALPFGALLVMCLAMGGPAMLVIAAYFLGCGMILSRKAVKTLLDQAPGSGGQQAA